MSVFVKTISELIALFLQALRLSVVLPAALLVGLNVALVLPRLEGSQIYRLFADQETVFPTSFVLILLTVFLAYLLVLLNLPIIRLFEGYPLLRFPIGRRLRLSNYRRILHLRKRIKLLDEERKVHEQQARRLAQEGKQKEARREFSRAYYSEVESRVLGNELVLLYPRYQLWRVLPTQLGNVIAAAEEYPEWLFGIDAVTFWPFLAPILQEKKFASFIESEKALLDFSLNMAVITLVFGAETFCLDLALNSWDWFFSSAKVAVTLAIAFCFYRLSIQGALSWGYTIRTAFALFKDCLRQRLGLRHVRDFKEECALWEDASRFYRDQNWREGLYIFKDQKHLQNEQGG